MVDTYDDDTHTISTSTIDDGSVRSDTSVDTSGHRDTDESSSDNGDDGDRVGVATADQPNPCWNGVGFLSLMYCGST